MEPDGSNAGISSRAMSTPEVPQDTVSGDRYPGKLMLGLITLSLCLVVLLETLDQTIVATAAPRISDDFKALGDVSWYGSAYLLTIVAFQLVFGKLYTIFRLRWCFLFAVGVFSLGSLICGVAQNSVTFIVGRAVAGLGCAGIFSGAMIVLAHSVPLRLRPALAGFVGSMNGIAAVCGPILGGVFTEKVSWRWCFFINLPACAVIAVVMCFTHSPEPAMANQSWKQKAQAFDFIGVAALLPGLVTLLLALQWGGSRYSWSNARVVALIVIGVVLLCVFAILQLTQPPSRATIQPRIISQRTVLFSAILAFCMGASFLVLVFYLPLWFQAVKGEDAMNSGFMILPILLGVVILGLLGGGFVSLIGYYVPSMILGTVLLSIGSGLLTTLTVDSPKSKWVGFQACAGMGIGLALQQPMVAIQTVLDGDRMSGDLPGGIAIIAFVQTMGGALFISVGQTLFNNLFISQFLNAKFASPPILSPMAREIDPHMLLEAGATSLKDLFTDQQDLDIVIDIYSKSLTRMFFIPAVMSALGFLASLRVEWRSVKDSGKVKGFRQGTESRARQIETNAALKDMEAVNGSEQLEKEDA